MDKLNICLINDSFPPVIDGVANAVKNYAQIINDKHGKAAVVTPYYPDADDSAYAFPIYRYPSLMLPKKLGYRAGIPFSPELMAQVQGEHFNLIHSHCPITSTLLARSMRDQLDLPLVLTYHTKFDIDIANAVRGKLVQEELIRLLVKNISACDEVWTVSRGAGENLRSLGFEGDYVVMPNGVDFPKGRVSREAVEAVTGEYDLPAGLPVLLFVGRMMWYKGIRIILDALKLLDGEGTDFRMVFVGGGGDKDEIRAYCSELGLDGKVIFIEPIRDRERIRAWYCRGDLFLFPSTFDTNGLVVREAAACALPSLLVRGSCAAEDVADGETGFLIEENAPSMAETLRRLLPRLDLVRRVGEQAQQGIYLSWEDSVANAWEGYGAVIDKYRGGVYERSRTSTDELLRNMGNLMELVNRLDIARTSLEDRLDIARTSLEDRVDTVRTSLEDRVNTVRTNLEDRVGETFPLLRRRDPEDADAQRTDRFL